MTVQGWLACGLGVLHAVGCVAEPLRHEGEASPVIGKHIHTGEIVEPAGTGIHGRPDWFVTWTTTRTTNLDMVSL